MQQKILIVDDTANFRHAVAAALRGEGYEVLCAKNGEDGLSLALTEHPGLILLDIAMPVIDGLSYLASLRAHKHLKDTPVIMLTASADVNHVREASGLGIQGYMLKSAFSLGEMIKKVEELIGAPAVFTHQ
ncbi:MAG: response regulator [Bdellovibrionales bacterium]|nr:response regulator [Bdellovibrionales bacterium]